MKKQSRVKSCGRIRLKVAVLLVLTLHVIGVGSVTAIAADNRQDAFVTTAVQITENCMMMDEITALTLQNMRDVDLDAMLLQTGVPCSGEDYKEILSTWQNTIEECGEYTGNSNLEAVIREFDYQKRNHVITLTGIMRFEERDAEVAFTFEEDGTVTAISTGGQYNNKEILKKAGLNTLIGMGTVFAVLILMSLVISCFGFIPKLQARFAKSRNSKTSSKLTTAAIITDVDNVATKKKDFELSEEELACVITTAVARQIQKRPFERSMQENPEEWQIMINGKICTVRVEERCE